MSEVWFRRRKSWVVLHVRREVIDLGGMRTRGHDMKSEVCWRGVSVGGNYKKPMS
jgi:hypothetical protein